MKIAFLINQTHKEELNFATTLLAYEAYKRGHTVMYIGLADFVYEDDLKIAAHVRQIDNNTPVKDHQDLLKKLRVIKKTKVPMENIDVLWLRFDPVMDMINRPWAHPTGLQFAQIIKKMGRLVINDPDQLILASNKLYLENFPKLIRPRTIVTRQLSDIQEFLTQEGEKIILKPLKGSGGKNVFMIKSSELENLKQTVEVIARDGYVIAQEYFPEATKGDIRFFLLNGEPIIIDGKYAAVQRVQPQGEIRSNIHQGAKAQIAEISEQTLALVKQVSPKLKADGMYFVGLDIVGDKIMEINIFSPGALGIASDLNQVDYISYIVDDLEQKIKDHYKN